MATEPHAPPGPQKIVAGSPIENEIPNYRAINPLSVVCILLALLSLLSFANEKFLIASILGVVAGAVAIRQIQTQPETWTGLGLARVGIALSLTFGIAAFTTSRVQTFIVQRKATQFAKTYLIKALNSPSLDDALWYRLLPDERKSIKPEEAKTRFRGPADGPESLQIGAGQVYGLHQVIARDRSAKVEFLRIERVSYDGITPTAFVLMKVHYDPDAVKESSEHSHDHDANKTKTETEDAPPEPPLVLGDYVGAIIKNASLNRSDAWWVQDYYYPYQPDSYIEAPKPVDDGHGH